MARSPIVRDDQVLAGGEPVARAELPAIARWTSLKLWTRLERYPFEHARDREPRVGAVRELVGKLAKGIAWKQLHIGIGGRSVPAPRPFTKAAFEEAVNKVALQRFNANAGSPLVLARTGGPDDVQYDWSLAITDLSIFLFAHDTAANRKTMDALFDVVRAASDAVPTAQMGHGFAGSLSSAALGIGTHSGELLKPHFHDHDEAMLTPPWRMHIGQGWLMVPEAAKRAASFAARQKNAKVDAHGLLFALPPPRIATDRSPARLAARTAFSTLDRAIGKIVNTAFHDAKKRRALDLPR